MTFEFIKRITKSLNKCKVEYVITGGVARLLRNEIDSTLDLDILVQTNDKNIEAIKCFISGFGIDELTITKDLVNGKMLRLKLFPFSMDILPKLDGLNIDQVFFNKESIIYENIRMDLIHRNDLIINYQNINKNE